MGILQEILKKKKHPPIKYGKNEYRRWTRYQLEPFVYSRSGTTEFGLGEVKYSECGKREIVNVSVGFPG